MIGEDLKPKKLEKIVQDKIIAWKLKAKKINSVSPQFFHMKIIQKLKVIKNFWTK